MSGTHNDAAIAQVKGLLEGVLSKNNIYYETSILLVINIIKINLPN